MRKGAEKMNIEHRMANIGLKQWEIGLRPLRAVGSIYEPEAVGAGSTIPSGGRAEAHEAHGHRLRAWSARSGRSSSEEAASEGWDCGRQTWEDEKVGNVRLEFVSS